jgi:hypothetical protein
VIIQTLPSVHAATNLSFYLLCYPNCLIQACILSAGYGHECKWIVWYAFKIRSKIMDINYWEILSILCAFSIFNPWQFTPFSQNNLLFLWFRNIKSLFLNIQEYTLPCLPLPLPLPCLAHAVALPLALPLPLPCPCLALPLPLPCPCLCLPLPCHAPCLWLALLLPFLCLALALSCLCPCLAPALTLPSPCPCPFLTLPCLCPCLALTQSCVAPALAS